MTTAQEPTEKPVSPRDFPGRDRPAPDRILVAGVGNRQMRDDGFGCEVVARLMEREHPDHVTIVDFGTAPLDLGYEVMKGYRALILVDAARRGGEPGTVYVLEPDQTRRSGSTDGRDSQAGEFMHPHNVLRFVKAVAGWPGEVVVVACEPAENGDSGDGLSDPVLHAIDEAVEAIELAVARITAAF